MEAAACECSRWISIWMLLEEHWTKQLFLKLKEINGNFAEFRRSSQYFACKSHTLYMTAPPFNNKHVRYYKCNN